MRHFIACLLLLGTGISHAATVTIDFEELPAEGNPLNPNPPPDSPWSPESTVSQGFEFRAASESQFSMVAAGGAAPTNYFAVCSTWPHCADIAYLSFSQQSGELFDLQSLDLIVMRDSCMVIEGTAGDGGWLEYDGGCSSTHGPGIFLEAGSHSLLFSNEWSGLERIDIHTDDAGPVYETNYFGVDNVAVNVIPIPAAAWLFGSALAGLGWMRRGQTRKLCSTTNRLAR